MNFHNFRDLTGQKFNHLTVTERKPNNSKGNSMWLCQCRCGKFTILRIDILKKSKTCGRCYLSDKHPNAYSSWSNAKQRCNNPDNPKYRLYGARGIKMDKFWDEDFFNFISDMGDPPWDPLYKEHFTLERKDTNKGYSKENCIWADRLTQSSNRRTNIVVFSNIVKETNSGKDPM